MKYNVSSCHKRYFKSLCHSPHLCLFSFHHNLSYITLLILLLSGDIDLNPGPEDEVKCVCESSDESSLMLQCDSCTCWSHSECVGCFLSCSKKIIFLSVLFALSQSSLSYPLFVLNFTPKSSYYQTWIFSQNSHFSLFWVSYSSTKHGNVVIQSQLYSQLNLSANHVFNQQSPVLATQM